MSRGFRSLIGLFRTPSLKRRLVLKVSGFVAVAMLLVTLAVTYVMRQELLVQANSALEEAGVSSQIQLENRIAYLVEATRRLADNPFMVNGLVDRQARVKDLPKLLQNFREGTSLSGFALLDFDGQPVYHAQRWLPRFNKSPELRAALSLGDTAVYTDAATAQLFIIAPVKYYQTTQGAVVAAFDMKTIVGRHATRDARAYLSLESQAGRLLRINYDPTQHYISKRLPASDATPFLQQIGLVMETGLPESVFDRVLTTTLSHFILIGVCLTLISAVMAAAIGRGIARPIIELHRRVSSADEGVFCSPLGTGDELDALAEAFDARTAALTDAQQQLTEQRDRFHYEANHDALTALPNRYRFTQWMADLLGKEGASSEPLALIYIDLDRFKLINDSLGHPVGDQVLQAVARRLSTQAIGDQDELFRHGGDEFLLLKRVDNQSLDGVLTRILELLAQPVRIGEHDLDVRASIGVTFYPQDGRDHQTLFRNADIAMYRAKAAGGGCYRVFDPQMSRQAFDRLAMEVGLRRAIDRNELRVFYQPQYEMRTGRLLGTEALVRWQHPEQGLLSPGHFLPIAEESRLIVDIGYVVLREACGQQANWYACGLRPGRVSVNLAGAQILDPNLVDRVAEALEQTGCQAQWLELEVTENFIMRDPAQAIPTLKRLRDMGISLAIDDFGTGYSSLAYLKRLPVTRLKIDQSFVRNAVIDPEDVAIIEAIIALANKLQLDLIAEGVETESQKSLLLDAGCLAGQGYLYSRPVPADELESVLRQNGENQVYG